MKMARNLIIWARRKEIKCVRTFILALASNSINSSSFHQLNLQLHFSFDFDGIESKEVFLVRKAMCNQLKNLIYVDTLFTKGLDIHKSVTLAIIKLANRKAETIETKGKLRKHTWTTHDRYKNKRRFVYIIYKKRRKKTREKTHSSE